MRCMMGLKCSPYFTIKKPHLAYEITQGGGGRRDPNNALQWHKVVWNLPGMSAYSPMLSWVYRVRRDGKMAGAVPGYVDDLRPIGFDSNHCWAVAHQTASRWGCLGIQVALQKT